MESPSLSQKHGPLKPFAHFRANLSALAANAKGAPFRASSASPLRLVVASCGTRMALAQGFLPAPLFQKGKKPWQSLALGNRMIHRASKRSFFPLSKRHQHTHTPPNTPCKLHPSSPIANPQAFFTVHTALTTVRCGETQDSQIPPHSGKRGLCSSPRRSF